jgi:hypothetical protein
MERRMSCGLAGLALLLGGCGWNGSLDDLGWRTEAPPLQRVLVKADDTPGNQSLLYTAMREAEAAVQSATRARLAADDPAEARQALGEVLYAVEPSAAPDWRAMATGIVPGWSGEGYGLLYAAREIRAALSTAEAQPGGTGTAAGQALVCAENTIRRSEQILELGRQAMEGGDTIPESTLVEIEALATQLTEGTATMAGTTAGPDSGCGLEQAVRILNGLAINPMPV